MDNFFAKNLLKMLHIRGNGIANVFIESHLSFFQNPGGLIRQSKKAIIFIPYYLKASQKLGRAEEGCQHPIKIKSSPFSSFLKCTSFASQWLKVILSLVSRFVLNLEVIPLV